MTADLLHEAVDPHLASDEGQGFLRGQARQDEIRSLLSQQGSAESSQRFNQTLLKFMWEEIGPSDLQAELQHLFASNPYLKTPNLMTDFAPALSKPANSVEERARLKDTLCGLLGLITQPRDPSRPSLEDGIRFQQDVEERFISQPGKYEQFVRTGFGEWREDQGAGEGRGRLVEMLKDDQDLLERFGEIWPEKRGQDSRGEAVA